MIVDQGVWVGDDSVLLVVLGDFLLSGLLAMTLALGLLTTFVFFSMLPVFVLIGALPKFKPPIPLILFVLLLESWSALRLGVT